MLFSYMVKSSNDFQHSLNTLFLIISLFMVFFLVSVLHSMLYVYSYTATVHYMGIKKNKAETVAFVLSCTVLLLMGYPSLSLLYQHCTSSIYSDMSVNITGGQWYWSFELGNYHEDSVPMYISNLDSLKVGDPRFLSVDNRLVLPVGAHVNFFVTSSDVIHGFNLPSVGVKYDAVPGVLTVVSFDCSQIGLYIGQCSEICGAGHSFMPCVVEVSSGASFSSYLTDLGGFSAAVEGSGVSSDIYLSRTFFERYMESWRADPEPVLNGWMSAIGYGVLDELKYFPLQAHATIVLLKALTHRPGGPLAGADDDIWDYVWITSGVIVGYSWILFTEAATRALAAWQNMR